MIDKMAKYIFIGIFLFGILVGAGGFSLFHKCPQIKNQTSAKVDVKEKTDTSLTKKEISAFSPSRTRYVPASDSSRVPCPGGNFIPSEKISHWDTTTTDGFTADINYYHTQDMFGNHFTIPERIITKEKTITVTVNNIETSVITKLPQWELGIGIKTWYQESKLNFYPFASLTFNQKVFFFNTSLEFRGNANYNNGHVSLAPEVEGKIKIGL